MAVTIDWGNTYIINIPKADLTFVSGTFYTMDTDAFRLELKSLEASEAGMPFPKTHDHNTESVPIAGTIYARQVLILPPYSVQFEDGQYTVRLEGSNNNIFDVAAGILVQNQVQVIPTNSAGLIVSTGTGGISDWTEGEKKQFRDALGITGDKVEAEGGQLQENTEWSRKASDNAEQSNQKLN